MFGEVVANMEHLGGDLGDRREDQATITGRISQIIQRGSFKLRHPVRITELVDFRTQEELSMDGQPVVVDNPLSPDLSSSHEASGNRQY